MPSRENEGGHPLQPPRPGRGTAADAFRLPRCWTWPLTSYLTWLSSPESPEQQESLLRLLYIPSPGPGNARARPDMSVVSECACTPHLQPML